MIPNKALFWAKLTTKTDLIWFKLKIVTAAINYLIKKNKLQVSLIRHHQ